MAYDAQSVSLMLLKHKWIALASSFRDVEWFWLSECVKFKESLTPLLLVHLAGPGSSGWQSPEQLRHGRQTRSVDMFSLGCLLYFCITGGQHPFGSQFERDRNILHDQFDIFLVEHLPEASHLIRSLIRQDPKCRYMI